MSAQLHNDLFLHLGGCSATTIEAIEQERWRVEHEDTPEEHALEDERRRDRDAFMRRCSQIGMGLHWLRRRGWAEITMVWQLRDDVLVQHPYWRLTPLGRAECKRRGLWRVR